MSLTTSSPRGRYLTFLLAFWLIAALLMFLNGLRSDHWNQVVIRFFYFPIIGVLFSAALTLIYRSEPFRQLSRPWALIAVAMLSAVASVLTATILNPVTFLLLGINIAERHLEIMSTGMVTFWVGYAFWSFIFFQLEGRPLVGPLPRAPSYVDVIGVEDRGKITTLPVGDVECFLASGDYVEIHTSGRQFLKKETIAALDALLDPERFLRIHRSAIVNADHVESIKAAANGTFDLTLKSGRTLASSRSYRAAVQALKAKN